MRSTFQTLAAKHQIPVIDTTVALRMAGKQELQHGPNDWNHLNETGYRTLSDAILQQLEPLLARMSKQAVVIKQPPKS
jgi:lysophospholipase L1-like esterase